MSAGIIPSTLLAVEGSARTFTWVDVMPSTRTIVGAGEGACGLSETTGVADARSAGVPANGEMVGVNPPAVPEPQPVLRSVSARKDTTNRRDSK